MEAIDLNIYAPSLYSVAVAPEVQKKALALTLAQARVLIDHALGRERLTLSQALEIVKYRQARNYAAYRSHRKRTLKINRLRAKKPK